MEKKKSLREKNGFSFACFFLVKNLCFYFKVSELLNDCGYIAIVSKIGVLHKQETNWNTGKPFEVSIIIFLASSSVFLPK